MKSVQNIWRLHATGLLNSYAQIFFARSRWFGALLLAVSFVNPMIGFSGLAAVVFAQGLAQLFSLDRKFILEGWYGFNCIMLGMGMGATFDYSVVFFLLLLVAVALVMILLLAFQGILSKYQLPFMGLPFILGYWCVLLAAPAFQNLGPGYTAYFYQTDYFRFINTANDLPVAPFIITFLRSLGAVFFQSNAFVGAIIAIGLLFYSRISFILALIGFATAYAFYKFTGIDTRGLNEFYVGANYSFTAIAIGGFFLIPNRYTFLLAVAIIPVVAMVHYGAVNALTIFQLPAFTLAFTISTLALLYFLKWRIESKYLHLVVQQFSSPEKNLRHYYITADNYRYARYFPVTLPFWGEWMVSQGNDGTITHLGDWSKALDFVLLDEEMKTYANPGTELEDFYCYNKPVLAPADGYVAVISDNIEDNEVSDVNTEKNWGNSIVIDHGGGLFSQISHLKKNSFKTSVGSFVKRGEMVAVCGNSGRSPEPHIHFQMQTIPVVGAKTLAYPIASFISREGDQFRLRIFEQPREGEFIRQVETHPLLREAFQFTPGKKYTWEYSGKKEVWEVYTDAWNRSYLYCAANRATAWFVNDGVIFKFLEFKGNTNGLLYRFYLGCYKVFLGFYPQLEVKERYPVAFALHPLADAVQDVFLPFFAPVSSHFQLQYQEAYSLNGSKILRLASSSKNMFQSIALRQFQAEMIIGEGTFEFWVNEGDHQIKAVCVR
ncbi:MAG: urea transporter [Chitinophagales bacterium]